jgi:hypothetical protein
VGKMKNELDMMIRCCEKALLKQIIENPKSGLIVDKGKPEETRMKYKVAKRYLTKLQTYFGLKGAFTFGICEDCKHFNKSGHNSLEDCCGDCKVKNILVTSFDSCERRE